jgi:hypothetical protein
LAIGAAGTFRRCVISLIVGEAAARIQCAYARRLPSPKRGDRGVKRKHNACGFLMGLVGHWIFDPGNRGAVWNGLILDLKCNSDCIVGC